METNTKTENLDETNEVSSPINLLFFSSFMFMTNVISAVYNNNYLYALLFGLLTISSLVVHSYDNIFTNIVDKFIIGLVVIYGGYVLWSRFLCLVQRARDPATNSSTGEACGGLWNKSDETNNMIITIIIIVTFLFCVWVYVYGYKKQQYCFDPEKCIADKYHCLMHIIASIGHHLIIIF